VAASRRSGVDAVTGEGLTEALRGAAVVVDVSNSPSFQDAAVMKFFKTSTHNLLTHGAAAGVGHHVALSVVGNGRFVKNGYFRAKLAQEKLIKESPSPSHHSAHTVLRVRREHLLTLPHTAMPLASLRRSSNRSPRTMSPVRSRASRWARRSMAPLKSPGPNRSISTPSSDEA
jgi:hypothetical protein